MDTDSFLAPLEDACTVVLLRDGKSGLETLMLERHGSSSAFGGMWVFPGGKVDPEDRIGPGGTLLDDDAAARVAGLRELAEETGQQLAPGELAWLARWTPMQAIPRRFRTWFMLAPANGNDVVLNPAEHERHTWLTPREVLKDHAEGAMKLVPPTWLTLHNLSSMESVGQALAAARNSPPTIYNTHLLLPGDGGKASGVVWDGDAAYPGSTADARARNRLLMTGLPWVFEHAL